MIEAILTIISAGIAATIERLGYSGLFLLTLLGSANIPLPSEIALPFSGFLAATGKFNFWLVVLAATAGDLAGSLISYFLAHRLEASLQQKRNFKTAEKFFQKFGEISVFLGRLIPVIRAFISFPAGLFKVKLKKFIPLTVAGSFIWMSVLTYIGFVLGNNWSQIEPYFRKFNFLIALLLIGGVIWWARHHFGHNKKEL